MRREPNFWHLSHLQNPKVGDSQRHQGSILVSRSQRHYLARVQTVYNIDDGVKYLKWYTALLKSKNLIASASAIKTPKAGKLYKVATSRMEFRKKEGGTYQVDVYARYGFGRGRNRVIRFEPHTTEEHKDMLIEFVQKVD